MENENRENRLIGEQSPYLLQHAHNPVDWYPWNQEAFQRAKEEDKPVFLSIGYSTCHWCHVMEKESFENRAVAEELNRHFIAIKVDREELPDIDSYYMTVCQLLTGSGGWPLTIVMTPDKEPFFAATYIPRESRGGRTGMLELLPALNAVWKNRRSDVSSSVSSIMDALQSAVTPESGSPKLSEELHSAAFAYFRDRFDGQYGGFGAAPKFPSAHNLIFLLRYWHRTGEAKALEMVKTTLTHMKNGGIYDHVGFGFHRYSTDNAWHLPHFEKMLYDQAMLAHAYLEAFEATGNEFFGEAASEIFAYVLRDLQSPEGGFYTAEDADSEGEEGLFYLWSAAELEEILGEDYPAVAGGFGITPEGNYAEEAGGQKPGLNLFDRSDSPLPAHWNELREKLFCAREARVHPLKDDKILTDWNGLMISALSRGARILQDSKHLQAAQKAADFLLGHMIDKNGRLLHRYREGQAAVPGYLDDYAFFIQGLIDLYQTSFDAAYLKEAIRLANDMITFFFDQKNGGFYSSTTGAGSLPFRQKESVDSALPSGNSVAFGDLLRLSWLTGNTSYLDCTLTAGTAFSGLLEQYPFGHTMMLAWHELLLSGPVEVIIVGDPDANDTRAMVSALSTVYCPESVVLLKPVAGTSGEAESPNHGASAASGRGASKTSGATGNELDEVVPFAREYVAVDGKATAYVCRNFSCNLPTTDTDEMIRQTRGNG